MNEKEFKNWIKKSQWKFAKSAKDTNPHFYTLIHGVNRLNFIEAAKYINANGSQEWFWKRPYTVLKIDGWKYWTMTTDYSEIILINKTKDFQVYDKIADNYDFYFSDPKSKAVDEAVRQRIGNLPGTVLDIGAGTGLLLEMVSIPVEKYFGIDPSPKMNEIFKQKFPNFRCYKQPFEILKKKGFDNVVSLYGSVNYILPEYINKIENDNPKARLFLMFFNPDYYPETYIKSGVFIDHFVYSAKFLESLFGVKPYQLGNYLVINKHEVREQILFE